MFREVRLGLALNGGVSLAIWIGGVADELLRAVSAGEGHPLAQAEWVDLCSELDLVVQIDVVVGTSAGGVNGAFLATGLANDAANLVALQDLWINSGDFSLLLHPPRASDIRSLLRGDTYVLPQLQSALEAVAASGRGERDLNPPLDIRLTSTNLEGQVLTISDGESALQSLDHSVEFRFTDDDFHFQRDPLSSQRVARACRSTASFPGAFEASTVPAGLYEPRHAPALANGGPDGDTVGPAYLVDGGVLNNLPARNAVEAIAAQPAAERVHRVLALVVPDPVTREIGEASAPLVGRTVGQSTLGIPRNQSMSSFQLDVRNHNNDVLSRRAARTAFLGDLGGLPPAEAWSRFLDVAQALFPSYCAGRHRRSCDRILARLSDRVTPELASVLMRTAGDAGSVTLPWIPREYADKPGDYWGGSPVRRLVALMVTWTNLAVGLLTEAGDAAGASQLLAAKAGLSKIRDEANHFAPVGAIDALLLEELAKQPHEPVAAFETALRRWSETEHTPGLDGLVGRLGEHLGLLVGTVRPHLSVETSASGSESARTMRGLVTLHDGAGPSDLGRLVLGFEVVEMAFGPADPPPDQTIRLAHFTADEAVTMDPAQRDDPDEKLAGVQLGHFAAFLKRSWRANDWMWGRLDAAERMVRLLDEATEGQLTSSGRLDHHLRAVQSAVLRDLLPVVAAEIEADGRAGANVSEEARIFADAVTRAGTPDPDRPGRVTLAGVPPERLAELLALNLVGVERLAGEVGMPHVGTLMLNAATTTAALLRAEAPRGVRGFGSFMCFTSTTLWRWRQLSLNTRRVVAAAVLAIAVASGIFVVATRTGGVPGWVAVPAWVLLVVTLVLLAGRVAIQDVKRRSRRAAARARIQARAAAEALERSQA